MVDNYHHVKHCTTHPKFLHSNSTSHRWVFGAVAELIDNAIDSDVSASQFCIDMKEFNGEACLVFMDNGCGLVPEKLHKMLSFGHSKKQMSSEDRSIGKHGNGFKSGTMRLGKDVLVLTKCADSMTVGFLSQTFLEDTKSEDILIPQVSWDLNGNRLSPFDLEVEESLRAIYKYSMFPDEESLLAQLQAIPVTGAILIISNLRRHEGVLELDFDTDEHDIRIASEINSSHFQQLRPNQPNTTEVPMDYSLRAYVSILYKVPRMQIFIRDKKVKTKRIAGILSQKETENYKPTGVGESIKIELGFNTENKSLYGMMLYHRNRLIKAYMRVGMQLEENERGMGVLGLAEADFLQPTHNKQEFDDTTAYRRLLKKLSDVLAEYWWEKKERVHEAQLPLEKRAFRRDINGSTSEDVPDVIWVQCDNPTCLKWRVLPPGTDVSILPDIWYCEYHPDAKFRVHEEPEQEWDPSVRHEIVERRKERKREYDREKKEREAERKRQRLEAIAKEKQMEEDKGKQVKELAKQVASLSAEKEEIMRKLEKAQAELFRKAKEKEDGARLSTQQVQLEQPGEKLCSLNVAANGHATERQPVSPPPLSIGYKEDGNLRGLRGTEDRIEPGMPRRRLHRRASVPVSASHGVHQPALQSNGDLYGHVASGSPSPNAVGNSRRSVLAPKAVTQGSRHVQATTSINALSKDLVVRGSSEGSQHSQRKGRNLSLVNDRALILHGSSAEKRRRISTGSVASQLADIHLPSSQAVEDSHSMPLGEVLLGAGTPVPSTPSQGFPSSKSPAFTPAQQMCSLNQESQTLVTMDHRSPLLADSSRRDRVLPSVAAYGASVVRRSRDKFTQQGVEHSPVVLRIRDKSTQQGVEHSPEAHQSMDSGNGRHARPDNGVPSSGLRSASPCAQNTSGMLSVDLPVDCPVSASNDRSETELTREFFKTQRQFRLAINTLRKIGGAGDTDLVELDSLPVEDSEVVDICETANQNHETMLQNGRQEAAKLKAELAYLMVDKMQHGQGQNFKIQSVANNWGIGVDVPR